MAKYKYYLKMILPCYIEADSFEEVEEKLRRTEYDIEMSASNLELGDEIEVFTYHFGGEIDDKPFP